MKSLAKKPSGEIINLAGRLDNLITQDIASTSIPTQFATALRPRFHGLSSVHLTGWKAWLKTYSPTLLPCRMPSWASNIQCMPM
jgi:hypothetical protein